jgi:hypothetical protein
MQNVYIVWRADRPWVSYQLTETSRWTVERNARSGKPAVAWLTTNPFADASDEGRELRASQRVSSRREMNKKKSGYGKLAAYFPPSATTMDGTQAKCLVNRTQGKMGKNRNKTERRGDVMATNCQQIKAFSHNHTSGEVPTHTPICGHTPDEGWPHLNRSCRLQMNAPQSNWSNWSTAGA